MNLSGQSIFLMTCHSQSRFTELKALVKSICRNPDSVDGSCPGSGEPCEYYVYCATN